MASPAYALEGLQLEGGWTVGPLLLPGTNATGGNFSCSYNLTKIDGTEAFLKALDFSEALTAPDPGLALNALTQAYIFERDILRECRNRNLDRIVRAITDGKIKVDDSYLGTVQYLIFESADGDIRNQLDVMGHVEDAWKLRSLHHIATGLKQLHGNGMAHQDVKPSNVLVFGGSTSKIGGVGCASKRGSASPRDHMPCAGDPAYAPPETLFGYLDPEWNTRRLGCDLYLLGSMAVFFFTSLSMTSLLFAELHPNHRPVHWAGTYTAVLAYVRDAFDRAIQAFEVHVQSDRLKEDLRLIVRQLCDPDPALRGHPQNRESQMSLLLYVTRFDLLAPH